MRALPEPAANKTYPITGDTNAEGRNDRRQGEHYGGDTSYQSAKRGPVRRVAVREGELFGLGSNCPVFCLRRYQANFSDKAVSERRKAAGTTDLTDDECAHVGR